MVGHVLDLPCLAGDLGLEEGALGLGRHEGADAHRERAGDRGGEAAEGDRVHVAQRRRDAGEEADGRDEAVVQPEDELADEPALGRVPRLVVEALDRLGQPGDRRRNRTLLGLCRHQARFRGEGSSS